MQFHSGCRSGKLNRFKRKINICAFNVWYSSHLQMLFENCIIFITQFLLRLKIVLNIFYHLWFFTKRNILKPLALSLHLYLFPIFTLLKDVFILYSQFLLIHEFCFYIIYSPKGKFFEKRSLIKHKFQCNFIVISS